MLGDWRFGPSKLLEVFEVDLSLLESCSASFSSARSLDEISILCRAMVSGRGGGRVAAGNPFDPSPPASCRMNTISGDAPICLSRCHGTIAVRLCLLHAIPYEPKWPHGPFVDQLNS